MTASGIQTSDGHHELDAIIVGTGYDCSKFLYPIEVVGRSGVRLADVWAKDGARAYLGITIPKMPNFFCIYGPNTNPKTGALFMWEELHVRYAIQCLQFLIESGHRSLECRQEAYDDYNERIDRELEKQIWMDQRQRSYYRNDFNRVDVNMPWMPEDYYQWTEKPEIDDFIVE